MANSSARRWWKQFRELVVGCLTPQHRQGTLNVQYRVSNDQSRISPKLSTETDLWVISPHLKEMVPDIETDGGTTEMSRDENVEMSRNAVRDGVLDAIGTVSLLGFSLFSALHWCERSLHRFLNGYQRRVRYCFLACWPRQRSISSHPSAINIASVHHKASSASCF